MIPTHIVEQAKKSDCIPLIGKYSELRKETPSEFAGPCPKCGGTDRLHVKRDGWFCRQCHEKWGDAIEFVRWMDGDDFTQAVSKLTGWQAEAKTQTQTLPAQPRQPEIKRPEAPTGDWLNKVQTLVQQYQTCLYSAEGAQGRDYLISRGLSETTWRTFGLGFRPADPDPVNQHKAAAIAMPWVRAGKVWAVRYRFLQSQSGKRLIAEGGSVFSGGLYGGQGLLNNFENLRTLVLCEGEINAMSIWQTCFDWRWDVLSLGSESATLSDVAVTYAKKFQRVLIWMDRAEIAKKFMAQVPGSLGISSPIIDGKKRDANDMMCDGSLQAFLVKARLAACLSDAERKDFKFNLLDANEMSPCRLDDECLGLIGK